MDRRTFLGALAAGTSAALAGCGGDGDGDRPQGTLITGGDDGGGGGGGGDGGGGVGTSTEPPTTGAQDVFTGVEYDIFGDDGETVTTWTVENTSDRPWSVTVISTVIFQGAATGATPRESTISERITLGSGEQTTIEHRHDGSPDAWSDFEFDFNDLQRA